MTSSIFMTILVIGAVLIFVVVSFLMMSILDNSDSGFAIGIIVALSFVVIFANLTPSTAQLVENDYYAMMEDRPKCIEAMDVSLGCKKDYIDWQKDSVEKQYKYDSVKVKLENLIIKTDTARATVVRNDTRETDSVKTCIEQCWNLILNSDIKNCQDECFK